MTIKYYFLKTVDKVLTHKSKRCPSTREAETGRSLCVLRQPCLQSECQDRLQSYTEKPCLEKPKKRLNYTEEVIM